MTFELFTRSEALTTLEFGGGSYYACDTNSNGVAVVGDLADSSLYVEAEGYVSRMVFVPGKRSDVEVALTRFGSLTGNVTDRFGKKIANAEIQYRIDTSPGLVIEGITHSDPGGKYRLPIHEEQWAILRQETAASVHLFASHPEAGRLDRIADLQADALRPGESAFYSELDLVLLPDRSLVLHLLAGAEPVDGVQVIARFAWGHGRDPFNGGWQPAPELERFQADHHGTVEMLGLPAIGDAWFYVQSPPEDGRKLLATIGPVRLEDVDEEWWIQLPQASELGAIEFELSSERAHSLILQSEIQVVENLRYSAQENRLIRPGPVRIENLLPGRYVLGGLGEGRSVFAEVHAGATTRLGTIAR